MIIKKFTGKTEAEATEAAKKELGSTLVIMNVREVKKKGLFAFLLPKQIEVTAALEEEAPARPQYGSILRTAADKEIRTEQQNLLAKNSTENIEKKLDSLQTLLESQLNNRQSEKEESAKTQDVPDAEEKEDKTQDMAAAEKKEEEKNPEQDKFIRLLYNKMSTAFWKMLQRRKKQICHLTICWQISIRKWCSNSEDLKGSLLRKKAPGSYCSSDLREWARRLP